MGRSSKPQMNKAPPPSETPKSAPPPSAPPPSAHYSQPRSIKASKPSIISSIVTGFGHGIGISMANTLVRSIFPNNNEHVPKVIDKCIDIKCEFDKCLKDNDSGDCFDMVKKYQICINEKDQ
jgi:hypothetical protein